MSTTFLFTADKSCGTADIRCDKRFIVHSGQQSLAEYLRAALLRKRFSYGDLARESGDAVSTSTVSDILNCRVKDIKAQTLITLAKGLGVPPQEVFSAYLGQSVPTVASETSSPKGFTFLELNKVPKEIRPLVIRQIRALIEASTSVSIPSGHGGPPDPPPNPGGKDMIHVPYMKFDDYAPEIPVDPNNPDEGDYEESEQGVTVK